MPQISKEANSVKSKMGNVVSCRHFYRADTESRGFITASQRL